MIRVTADSNIFISAFLRGGKPLELLEFARTGQVELFVTEYLLAEVERVLRTKFRVGEQDVQEFRHEICSFATLVVPIETVDAVPADPTDNRILECAMASAAHTIVSGDRHLLQLGAFRGIKIQRLAEFLGEIPVPPE